MKYMEQAISVLRKMFGKTKVDDVHIFFKVNKNEAEVHVNGKYWATYELEDLNLQAIGRGNRSNSKTWINSPVMNFSDTLISYIETSDGKSVAQTRGQETGEENECLANAKLMSAAPEMLDALISAEEFILGLQDSNVYAPFPTRSELDNIRKAINRARL